MTMAAESVEAVSVCAEVIALRTGKQAPSRRYRDGPIHAGGPPTA